MTDLGQLLQQPPAPVTLEEYMPRQWFRMVERRGRGRSPQLYRMIIINVDYKSAALKSRKTIAQ